MLHVTCICSYLLEMGAKIDNQVQLMNTLIMTDFGKHSDCKTETQNRDCRGY